MRFPITAYILWMFSLREAPFQKTLELPPTNIGRPGLPHFLRIFKADVSVYLDLQIRVAVFVQKCAQIARFCSMAGTSC